MPIQYDKYAQMYKKLYSCKTEIGAAAMLSDMLRQMTDQEQYVFCDYIRKKAIEHAQKEQEEQEMKNLVDEMTRRKQRELNALFLGVEMPTATRSIAFDKNGNVSEIIEI